jgi:hypothetical protein
MSKRNPYIFMNFFATGVSPLQGVSRIKDANSSLSAE